MINVRYLPTKEQPVDMLTKGLSRLQYAHPISKLGMFNVFALPRLKGSVVM